MASEMETTSSPLEARIASNISDLDDLKSSIMAGIDSKLSQKEETMWRRGLKEIKRLQSDQQGVLHVVGEMQEKQKVLATENQALRAALCDVTSKFELVVNEMRQALRQLPGQRGSHHGELSPSPSVASTAASDANPLGGLLHATELAQGRVLVGHLERALQRYGHHSESFEEAWMKLSVINEKARLVTELNNLMENRLEASFKIADTRDECRTLMGQYEGALRTLQKVALHALENHSASPAIQDESSSFIEPTPPSSKGNVSMTLGLTPSWPTSSEDVAEAFCTPPRASGPSEDHALMGDSSWQLWQGQSGFSGIANASPPAVLSLANALTPGPAGYSSPSAAASATTPTMQLQLAECLDEPTPQAAPPAASLGIPYADQAIQFATPPRSAFKVELQKEVGFTTLGMEVGEENGSIRVQNIDEDGLVGRHNRTRSPESNAVQVGDLIVEVNGVFGDPTAMLQECKSQQILILNIARGHPGASPAAASSAPSPLGANAPNGAAFTGCSDGGELDRVLAEVTAIPQFKEVAAPPASWGRLRPEAAAFVPSAQACESKSLAESLDLVSRVAQAKAPFHEALPVSEAPLSDSTSPTGSAAHSIAAAAADGGEDGVARLLFP